MIKTLAGRHPKLRAYLADPNTRVVSKWMTIKGVQYDIPASVMRKMHELDNGEYEAYLRRCARFSNAPAALS